MLLVAIAVAGLAFGREAAQGAIVAQLGGLAGGQTAAALEAMIASANNLGSGVIGIIITVILQILNSAIAFGIAALLFAMIFKILPAVPLTWRDVGMGASMTALLFTAGKFVIGYYIGKSGVASAYGAAASIITLLLWIYYSSLILLFGAEFTKAYAENRGSRTEVAQG
jgi:YihY family inner membrane protein